MLVKVCIPKVHLQRLFIRAGEGAPGVTFQHMLSYSNVNDHLHLFREAVAYINHGIRVLVELSEQNQNGPILIDNQSSSEKMKNNMLGLH